MLPHMGVRMQLSESRNAGLLGSTTIHLMYVIVLLRLDQQRSRP